MRNGAGWLQEHEAAARVARHNATTECMMRESEVIAFVIVTTERKLESVLPGCCAMARAGTASHLREDRLNMIPEAPFERLLHGCNRDFGGSGSFTCFRG